MTTYFFFNDTATTEIYTLSLHDALPILVGERELVGSLRGGEIDRPLDRLVPEVIAARAHRGGGASQETPRSEEHTSELQSRQYLVCRLLLEKKKTKTRECGYANHNAD